MAWARQHQEQRQHERDEDQPRRYLDVCRDTAGECTQHETDRNRDNVDDHLVLGPQRIEKLERCRQHRDSKERAAQYDAQHDRNCGEREGKPARSGNGEIPSRQRAVAFFSVRLVDQMISIVAGATLVSYMICCGFRSMAGW